MIKQSCWDISRDFASNPPAAVFPAGTSVHQSHQQICSTCEAYLCYWERIIYCVLYIVNILQCIFWRISILNYFMIDDAAVKACFWSFSATRFEVCYCYCMAIMLSDSVKSYKILGYLEVYMCVCVCVSENWPTRILSMVICRDAECLVVLLDSVYGTEKPGLQLWAQCPTSNCMTYCLTITVCL